MKITTMTTLIDKERVNALEISPVLGAFLRTWSKQLDTATRKKLEPYAARAAGTAGDGHDEWRGWLCVDWLNRTNLPIWLDLAGLGEHAVAVRSLIAISNDASSYAAQPILSAAWSAASLAERAALSRRFIQGRESAWEAAASVAWSAAESGGWFATSAAAGQTTRPAAWSAGVAGETAWSAAGSAAWSAAGSAAWSAAESAAGSAARVAMRPATWSAAESAAVSAAGSAVWSAAGLGESAAGSAAWSAVEPSVLALQASAFALLDRMIEGPCREHSEV